MPGLRLSFWGSPQVERDDDLLEISASKALALLVYLAVTGENHSRDALSTLLWPDNDQSRARTYLRHALWSLKKEVGERWLYSSREQIGFQADDDVWLDVAAFREGITAVSPHNHTPGQMCPDCLERLQTAVALYRDNFLAGFTLPDAPAFDEWQFFQAEELRQMLAGALEQLVEEHSARQEYDTAVTYARRWLSLDTLHEPVHRTLMRLYALDGQQAAALRQYQECVRLLDEELGVEPEAETSALYETIRIRQLESPGRVDPVEKEPSVPPGSVPLAAAQPIAFVGRELEQDDLQRSLQNPVCRLLTIIGPGGMGKTRLALALAEASQPLFPDGVYFVSLAPLQAAEDIVTALGSSLGLQFGKEDDLLEQLLRYLRRKHLLLVLDNFEHLIAGTGIVAALLEAAPQIKIVVTSRERLVLSSEVVYPLAGLRFPDQMPEDEADPLSYSGVQLLWQRARAIRQNLELDAPTLAHVVRICQMVEGMPLALVLAASWLDMLSFAEVADEIARGLDFLAAEMSDLPDRQRSMRAVFDTSWKRLTAGEQQVLMGLTVFHGGFVREAAQVVTQSGPRILHKLVNKSLLVVDENGRFDMHQLLRQYIQEQLHTSPTITQQMKAQHAGYYASFLYEMDSRLKSEHQREALAMLENELENIRAVWHWLVQQRQWDTLIYQVLPALFRYCELRFKAVFLWPLLEEARKSLLESKKTDTKEVLFVLLTVKSAFFYTGATNRLKVDNETRIGDRETVMAAWQLRGSVTDRRNLRWQILLALFYGQLISPEAGIAALLDFLPHLRQKDQTWELGLARQNLGQLYLLTKEQPAESYLAQALDIFQRMGDAYESSITLYLFGLLFMRRQQLTEAQTYFALAQQNFSEKEDFAIFALINWELADVYIGLGKPDAAIECLQQSYQMFMARGSLRSALSFLSRESYESLRYGTIEHAVATREECLAVAAEADDPLGEAWYIWEMGEIYRVMGELDQARLWYERAHSLFKKYQDQYDRSHYQQGIAFYQRGLGNIAFVQKEIEQARHHLQESLKMAQASGHRWITAYVLVDLGRAILLLEQHDTAQQYFVRALRLAKQIANGGMAMIALAGVTMLHAVQGRGDEAHELGAVVFNHPLTWQETKVQVAALLGDKFAAAGEQTTNERGVNWAWLDIVDQQIELLGLTVVPSSDSDQG